MSYTPALAATLSGATLRQLSYWRRDTGQGPLLPPEYGSRPRVHYSYNDIIALRMFVKLRGQTSLQRIRKAVAWLQDRHPRTHLSSHSLQALPGGKSIVWISDEGDFFDVVERPGQTGIHVVMEDIFREFKSPNSKHTVPNLERPAPGLIVDPGVRGGIPVLEGTRIPYNVVAGLRADGLELSDIAEFYPNVTALEVRGALSFATMVQQVSGAASAA